MPPAVAATGEVGLPQPNGGGDPHESRRHGPGCETFFGCGEQPAGTGQRGFHLGWARHPLDGRRIREQGRRDRLGSIAAESPAGRPSVTIARPGFFRSGLLDTWHFTADLVKPGEAGRRAWTPHRSTPPPSPAASAAIDRDERYVVEGFQARCLWRLKRLAAMMMTSPACTTVGVRRYVRSSRAAGRATRNPSTTCGFRFRYSLARPPAISWRWSSPRRP